MDRIDELIIENKIKEPEEAIDASGFQEIGIDELKKILGLTIKYDDTNKIITFLCMLSAYTSENQFNLIFTAPSSTGKTYIPSEVARLFPQEDIMEVGFASPTSFFHDKGDFDKETGIITVDFERKILFFTDQPNVALLERLRPLMSHDNKNYNVKITDRSKGSQMRTKNIVIKGYFSTVFCTTSSWLDEQEQTRCLLLSPEMTQEKIRAGVEEQIKRISNKKDYNQILSNDEGRQSLIQRIKAIKQANVNNINIKDNSGIGEIILSEKSLMPRKQREINYLFRLVYAFALLNCWHRERQGNDVYANSDDIASALALWAEIHRAQEYGLSPYIFNLFEEVIVPAFQEKQESVIPQGLTRKDIINYHYQKYNKFLPEDKLKKQILPMLIIAGLLREEPSETNKSHPVYFINQNDQQIDQKDDDKNSGVGGGVGGFATTFSPQNDTLFTPSR